MSTLRVNTLQDATGNNQPAMPGAAKAWVNFNGTGTVAIRAAFNVSSVTDGGTGDYTVNFNTAMVDANYSDVITISDISSNIGSIRRSSASVGSPSTTTRRFQCFNAASYADQEFVSVAVFR